MIDTARFFDLIRTSVFGGSMTQKQVNGVTVILDEADKRGTPLTHLAYLLATPCIETGMRFEPMEESLNYSVSGLLKTFSRSRISKADAERYGRKTGQAANQEAIGNILYGGDFGRAQLGNTEAGDGYRFRGRGLAQLTGRRNYMRASSLAGVNLVNNPDRAKELHLSVVIMFDAMENGWFTGKKLSDYLDQSPPDFVNARRTINGTDKAEQIAAFARSFYAALNATWTATRGPVIDLPPSTSSPVPPPPDVEPSTPSPVPTGFWGALARLWEALFGKKAGT